VSNAGRVAFDTVRPPAHRLGHAQRRAEAGERIEHQVARTGVLGQEPLDERAGVPDVRAGIQEVGRQGVLLLVPQPDDRSHRPDCTRPPRPAPSPAPPAGAGRRPGLPLPTGTR
jgi:hypothetical protein